MNCVEIQTCLAENLSSRLEAPLAEHLAGCAECARACEELLELEELSKSLSGRFRVPASFQGEVLSRYEADKPVRRWRGGLAVASVVLFATLAVVLKPWEVSGDREPVGSQVVAPVEFGLPKTEPEVDFVEIVVPVEGDDDMILRLPSVIEIHRSPYQEDFYISNVSH